MAKILSSETSPFIDKQIEIYSKNKVGQFSKYLDKNPIYVTYYHINQALSKADVGLGSTKNEVGPNSSIRYNKIKELPLYGISDLKPDTTYDEAGLDVDLDASGITVPPGTIRPIPGDYVYFKFQNMANGVLWRVNNRELSSIQSNDFYQIDLSLYATSDPDSQSDAYRQLEAQVAENYTCIFDNIGTKDKCIIKDDQYDTALSIGNFLIEMLGYYTSAYYDKAIGTFAYRGIFNGHLSSAYFYDMNAIKFMKDTQICMRTYGQSTVIALNYDDILPLNFDLTYAKLLWYAIEAKSPRKLKKNAYYKVREPLKSGSPFKIYAADILCDVVDAFCSEEEIDPSMSIYQSGYYQEYFPKKLIDALIDKSEFVSDDYRYQIIYDYISNDGKSTILDMDKLSSIDFAPSIEDYMACPILIYILSQYYDSFFDRSDEKSWTDIVYGKSTNSKTNM